jgi:hypothetical protein
MEQNQERINNQKEFMAILAKYGITQAKAEELMVLSQNYSDLEKICNF